MIKYGLDWIGKTWTGLIKHRLIKHGSIKHGLIKHGFMNKKGVFFVGFIGSEYDKHDLRNQPQPVRATIKNPIIGMNVLQDLSPRF